MSDLLAHSGQAEHFKASVHLGIFGLAAMCFGYNLMAWGQRRESHLAVNVGAYAVLMAFETQQIYRHLDSQLRRIE